MSKINQNRSLAVSLFVDSSATAELLEESRAQCLSRRCRFKCAECNRRFASWSRLETHMMTHDNSMTYISLSLHPTLTHVTANVFLCPSHHSGGIK